MDNRPLTIFCDIDGTLVRHDPPHILQSSKHVLRPLKGTLEKLAEWDKKGYTIILVTGRKEGLRKATERQLEEAGIIYDRLIMGIGGGKRVLINDLKVGDGIIKETAKAINLERNEGIKDIEL